jgi:hypothetical protein
MIDTGPIDTGPEGGTMRAVVVYESMFGNTHVVAEHIADGIGTVMEAAAVSVHDASSEVIGNADLVVVGGPTHIHGLSSKRSREGAIDMAAKDDDLELDPDALGDGLRDWFEGLADDIGDGRRAAAFDTRIHATTLVTGQASKGIAKRLRAHGFDLAIEHESFFVDKANHLEPDEAERATSWGQRVAEAVRATD